MKEKTETMMATITTKLACLGRDNRGQSMVEFALSLPFLVFLTIGSFAIGVGLERYLTVGQLVRYAGNMYARDIDFDNINSPARRLLVEAGGNLRLSTAKGTCDEKTRSVVYLTQVQITPDEPPGTFVNEGLPVIMHRTIVGCDSIGVSAIGTPDAAIWDPATGEICGDNVAECNTPFNEPRAANITVPASVTNSLVPGSTVFMVEVIHQPNDILFPGFLSPETLYTRGVF
jgi:hypothetical protein